METPSNPLFKATWYSQSPPDLLVQVGEWLMRTDTDSALQYFKAAYALDSNCSIACWYIGQIMKKSGRFAEATEWYEKSLIPDSDHTPTHHALAVCALAVGDFNGCIAYADQCLAMAPNHDGAHLAKIEALSKLERWRELIALFESRNAQHNPRLLFHYFLALAKMGDNQKIEQFSETLAPDMRSRFPTLMKEVETHCQRLTN